MLKDDPILKLDTVASSATNEQNANNIYPFFEALLPIIFAY